MDEVQALLDLMESFKIEINGKVNELVAETKANANIYKEIEELKRSIEMHRQLVKEYKEYKDPLNNKFAIEAIQKQNSGFMNRIQDIDNRIKRFEVEKWLKLFTDEQLYEQYELAGKPTHAVVASWFNVSVQNAHNYITGKVKDPELRWKFFLNCVDYAKTKKG